MGGFFYDTTHGLLMGARSRVREQRSGIASTTLRPMPLVPPVTKITLPERSIILMAPLLSQT
jgi:hypothetical protein